MARCMIRVDFALYEGAMRESMPLMVDDAK
jgi:hypothetical protein